MLYALIVANGEPFQSPAVNTVAYTAWFFVTSTFFMALCVTQKVLQLPQLRVVSAVLVVGQILVVGLAVLRHVAEAPVRDLCRRIRGGGPFEKYEFEKLYAAGGDALLEAAVFDAVQAFVADGFGGGGDDWDRFRGEFCALETFWKEPVAARHEKEKIEGWLKLIAEAGGEREPATRWAWLRREAKRRADELEAAIDRDLTVSDAVAALAEVNNEPGDPQPRQQLLLRSDGGTVTDAALAAVRSCTGATDLLVKSKLGLDETVLPPMLRVLAYALLPALKRALTDIAGRLDGIEVVCDDNKSVKKSKRMVAKMISEISREEAERRAQDDRWQPVSASVRDVLRATLVCRGQGAMCDAYEALEDDGRFVLCKFKNKLRARTVPFNLHALYEFRPNENVKILVEIQIHEAEIRAASKVQHKFYEIYRATSSVDLHKVADAPEDEVPPADLAAQESQRFMRKMARIQTSRGLWDTARARGVLRRVLLFRPRGAEKVQPD